MSSLAEQLDGQVLEFARAANDPAAVRHDAAAALRGRWPWYVVDRDADNIDHDVRAVKVDGEWRVYFETRAAAAAEVGRGD